MKKIGNDVKRNKNKQLDLNKYPEIKKLADGLLTPQQVSEMTGISEYKLGQDRHRNLGFEYVKLGYATFYRKADIVKWKKEKAKELKNQAAILEE